MTEKSPAVRDQSQKGFRGADYNYVALNAVLRFISLVSSSFKVEPSTVSEKRKWKLSYDWENVTCEYNQEDGNVAAIFKYNVTAKLGRKVAMKCEAEYVIYYEVPEDSEDEAAKGFCHNVGAFAAYPYFRALVAQFVANANLVLPPLPNIASTAHIPNKDAGKHDLQ